MTPPVQISCVIAVYNGERFLAETLESVLAQTYPLTEILVVDDGSTDGTRAVAESYVAKSNGVVRYLAQTNQGPAVARNLGIQAATGEFISFLDADDLWHPEKTARQLARFEARPELELSVTQIQNFWMAEVQAEEEYLHDQRQTKPQAGYLLQTILLRRALFNRIGLLDTQFRHAHFALWLYLAEQQKVVTELLEDVLVYRRLHLNNLSRGTAQQSREEYLRFFHMVRARQRVQATQGG